MPNNPEPTPRPSRGQLRRQQQREANLRQKENAPQDAPMAALRLAAPSEWLGPSVLVPVFCAMIVMGYLLFQKPNFAVLSGNELSKHQSLFTSVNAATLTGFQQARNPDNYTPAGQFLTFLLMMGGILFSFIGCGVAILRIARMRFSDAQLVLWAVGSVFVVAIFGGLAMMGGGRSSSQATFEALSAFGNCGLSIGTLPQEDQWQALFVLFPLAVLGGLGLPVLMDLFDSISGKGPLTRYSRIVLSWTAAVYICTTLLLFLLRWPGFHHPAVWRSLWIDSSQLSINARSAGLAFGSISQLPQAVLFVLIFVMIIGASPGGSGGGMKVTTLQVLSEGTLDTLQGRQPGRRFGVAILWAAVYLGLLLVFTVALLISEPDMKLDRTLFLAASALGNVGLSHNPVVVSTYGLYELSAAMILGRVAPMMMLWYVMDTTPDARVAVG